MNAISPRVANAVGAAGGSSPVTILFLAWLNAHYGSVDPAVAGAIAALITTWSAGLGGWMTRLEPQVDATVNAALARLQDQIAALQAPPLPAPPTSPAPAPAPATPLQPPT